MTYGLTIDNRFGYLQADSNNASQLVLKSSFTASSTTVTGNPLTGWTQLPSSTFYYRYVSYPANISNNSDALMFIRPTSLSTNADIKMWGAMGVGTSYATVFTTTPLSFDVAWFIRSQNEPQSVSSYGMVVYDDAGNVIFNSDQRFLNITNVVNYTFNFNGSSTVPYHIANWYSRGGSWNSAPQDEKPYFLLNTLKGCAGIRDQYVDSNVSPLDAYVAYVVRFRQTTSTNITLELYPVQSTTMYDPDGLIPDILSLDDSNQMFIAATIGV